MIRRASLVLTFIVAGCGGDPASGTTSTGGADLSAAGTTSTGGMTGATGGMTGATGGMTGSGGADGGADGGAVSHDMAIITGTGCGTCPTGYTCGSANGIPVCRASSGVPLFSNVFVVMMENTSLDSLQMDKTANSPYLHGLFTSAATSANYHGVTHPSLPNYIALTSGSPGVQADGSPVACDCLPQGSTCMACTSINTLLTNCNCEQTAPHIGAQLYSAHKNWRAYGEDMGTACNYTGAGNYAPRHIPFLYYTDVQMDAVHPCTSQIVDFGMLAADLTGTTPDLVYIAPNLVNDMHGTPFLTPQTTNLNNGDKWLAANLPHLTASAAYKKGGIIFVVWDEDDASGGIGGTTDDPIPFFVLSPLAKTGGFSSPTKIDHYALLATMEDGLGLGRIGGAVAAQPLSDFFPDR